MTAEAPGRPLVAEVLSAADKLDKSQKNPKLTLQIYQDMLGIALKYEADIPAPMRKLIAGTVRRLSLVNKPMEVSGHTADGKAFDLVEAARQNGAGRILEHHRARNPRGNCRISRPFTTNTTPRASRSSA